MTGTRGVARSRVREDMVRLSPSIPDRREPVDEVNEFLVLLCSFVGSTLTSENTSISNLSASALVRWAVWPSCHKNSRVRRKGSAEVSFSI